MSHSGIHRVSLGALALTLLLLVGLVQPSYADPASGASRITLTVEGGGETVNVAGRLVDSAGAGIGSAPIVFSVGSATYDATNTNGSGNFAAVLELPASSRNSGTVTATFAGSGDVSGSSASASYGDQAGGAGATLKASANKSEVTPEDLVIVSGSLTSGNGGIQNAEIDFSFGGTQLPNSTVFTGSNGSFEAYVEIPADASSGQANITVSFPGSGGFAATSQNVSVTVSEAVVVATDSPSPTPSASPSPTESESVSAEPSPTASAAASNSSTNILSSPFRWFWFALIGVGALSLLVFVALIVRRRGGSLREDPHGDELRLFNEGDPEPPPSEPAAQEVAAPTVVEPAAAETQHLLHETPAEPSRPRRGLPAD